jgi:hypothetical protein
MLCSYRDTVQQPDAEVLIGGTLFDTITVVTTALTGATKDVAYNKTVTATGGTAPRTFTLASGTLPVGLTLSTAGVLSGTPTTAATYKFYIRATDANGVTGISSEVTLVVAP